MIICSGDTEESIYVVNSLHGNTDEGTTLTLSRVFGKLFDYRLN